MNSLRAVVFFAIYFTSSHALQCYDCIFFDDFKNSDPTCQNQPNASLLKTCDDFPSPLDGEISVCKKITGFLDGKPVVVRKCSRSFSEINIVCITDEIRIGKSFTDDAYGCICSGERCNGATEIKFNYAPLFAIAVLHAFYRLI